MIQVCQVSVASDCCQVSIGNMVTGHGGVMRGKAPISGTDVCMTPCVVVANGDTLNGATIGHC